MFLFLFYFFVIIFKYIKNNLILNVYLFNAHHINPNPSAFSRDYNNFFLIYSLDEYSGISK